MRPILKSLLFTCAVCVVAQAHVARAQPSTQPTPTPNPSDPAAPDPSSPNPSLPPPGEPTPTTVPPPDTTAPDPSIPPATTMAPIDAPPPVDVDVTINQPPDRYSYAWRDDTLSSGIGVSTILGGGVVGFTDKTMRNTTSDVGGLWDLRVTLGSHVPLGLDVSYLGSAMNINGLPGGQSGTLVGTTVEGALRFNMLPHNIVNPYVFAGVGWQRYDVTETNVTLSDSGMNDTDNLVAFPVGAGLNYRMGGFVGDLRGTFRAASEQNLVLKGGAPIGTPTSEDFVPMHTWEASAAIGVEF
jgi:hypothetical protein